MQMLFLFILGLWVINKVCLFCIIYSAYNQLVLLIILLLLTDVRTKQDKTLKKGKERYHGIIIPQLHDRGVNVWCISWIEDKAIPVFTSARKNN